jgi:hypothetical protein
MSGGKKSSKGRSPRSGEVQLQLRRYEMRLNALEHHVHSAKALRQGAVPVPSDGLLEITITITGAQESAASIDGEPVPLSGWTSSTGNARVTKGKHKLRWHTKGQASGEYNVALSGQTEDWDDVYHFDAQTDGHGNHDFEATE